MAIPATTESKAIQNAIGKRPKRGWKSRLWLEWDPEARLRLGIEDASDKQDGAGIVVTNQEKEGPI